MDNEIDTNDESFGIGLAKTFVMVAVIPAAFIVGAEVADSSVKFVKKIRAKFRKEQ